VQKILVFSKKRMLLLGYEANGKGQSRTFQHQSWKFTHSFSPFSGVFQMYEKSQPDARIIGGHGRGNRWVDTNFLYYSAWMIYKINL